MAFAKTDDSSMWASLSLVMYPVFLCGASLPKTLIQTLVDLFGVDCWYANKMTDLPSFFFPSILMVVQLGSQGSSGF
jgi:hypothetical protein